jgi:hypothetical protein
MNLFIRSIEIKDNAIPMPMSSRKIIVQINNVFMIPAILKDMNS